MPAGAGEEFDDAAAGAECFESRDAGEVAKSFHEDGNRMAGFAALLDLALVQLALIADAEYAEQLIQTSVVGRYRRLPRVNTHDVNIA
ncbi:hypothetical protein GCM10009534_69340 [Kribbella sandramycini]